MANNEAAEYATKYVNSTNKHIFLTGKAGTGKTTFLRKIMQQTHKNAVVAAPTGIAAINAGGVTLHSLFQLPFGSFIPADDLPMSGNLNIEITTPKSLMKSIKLNKQKRALLRSLELLIIDEVSMLRADLLDAIDHMLRSVRRRHQESFGGIQVLFIGDLLQLPPVVKREELPYVGRYYESLYFFEAHALKNDKPIYIELEKIYRQADPRFIKLLNNLRNNRITHDDIQTLNAHYDPEIDKKTDKKAIFITTHNRYADQINQKELERLEGKPKIYKAKIETDFQPHQYPIEPEMRLKKGARVMFIKNDYSGEQRYYNGKIGTIKHFDEDGPVVGFDDNTSDFIVEPYTWENKRYKLNEDNNEIETIVKGTFTHYPLKLAWAVTVHKSQGLTFDRAIIDVSRAFAPGQIYVALSRLTSLDGLVLNAPMPDEPPQIEAILKAFTREKQTIKNLEANFNSEAWNYLIQFVEHAFDFQNIEYQLYNHAESYDKSKSHSKKQKHKPWADNFAKKIKPLKKTGSKFAKQVKQIADNPQKDHAQYLSERVQAARQYFENEFKTLTKQLASHAEEAGKEKGVKKYLAELKNLEQQIWHQIEQFHKAEVLAKAYVENTTPEPAAFKYRPKERDEIKKSFHETKQKKVSTQEISFKMFKAGMDIEKIAEERSLVPSTIEGHLSRYVAEGVIDVTEFISQQTFDTIHKATKTIKSYKRSELKQVLSDDYSYGDIAMALAGMKAQNLFEKEIMSNTAK